LDAERPSLRFPGAELVSAAAALFQSGPLWRGAEGRSFALVISAGTVGVCMADRARAERRERSAFNADVRPTREVFAPPVVVLEGEEGDLEFARSSGEPEWREPSPARQVEGWSRRSRARMVRTLAQLDWSPMYREGRPAVMLTLTYPGSWVVVAPNGKAVKAHHRALMKRWARKWGAEPPHPWKLEFQARGAPHLHLLVVPPDVDPVEFRSWLSSAWADVVAHPDPVERMGHERAGTGVDYLRGSRCFDPKRAAVYFSKHGGAAGGKEYQHTVPVEWQAAGAGPGRFWGYRGLDRVTAEVRLEVADYLVIRRTLRRWSKSQGMTRQRMVPRGINPLTGEVKVRRVTRRVGYLARGGLAGGTIVTNDGPAVASALARLISG
jgi:hypothetical protein